MLPLDTFLSCSKLCTVYSWRCCIYCTYIFLRRRVLTRCLVNRDPSSAADPLCVVKSLLSYVFRCMAGCVTGLMLRETAENTGESGRKRIALIPEFNCLPDAGHNEPWRAMQPMRHRRTFIVILLHNDWSMFSRALRVQLHK